MAKNKLYTLLSAFRKRELQDFRTFLLSPYFNQSPTLLELYDYIRPYHSQFENDMLQKELIFKALKPHKAFAKKFVNDRMSDLIKVLEDFLAIQYVKQHSVVKENLLRQSFLKHNLHEKYLKSTAKKIEKLEQKPRYTYQDQLELWSLKNDVFTLPSTNKFLSTINDENQIVAHLDEAYAIIKLRYGLHQVFRKGIFTTITISNIFLHEIVQHYTKSENIIIQLYLTIFKYFQNEDKKGSWETAYAFFLKAVDNLPSDEQLIGITALSNLGNKIAVQKNPEYFDKLLKLFQIGLDKKVWIQFGKFPPHTFSNIVTLGASTKQFHWTYEFIATYQKYLPSKEKENVVCYAKAYLAFYEGNFVVALEQLEIPEKQLNLNEKLRYRSLRARCLYEYRCHDSSVQKMLKSFLKSFSKFITIRKLADERRKTYQNFIYMITLLDSERDQTASSDDKKKFLYKKLEARKSIFALKWIQEKIEEM